MISVKRIQAFLLTNEVMLDCIHQDVYRGQDASAIKIERGTFYWKRRGEKDVKEDEDDGKKKGDKKWATVPSRKVNDSRSESVASVVTARSESIIGSKVDIAEDTPYIPILKDINLNVKQGEMIAIVGEYSN